MRSGDERMTRGGADEPQADWAPPFIPADDAGGGRARGAFSGGGAMPAAPLPVAWYVPFVGRLLMLMAMGMLTAALFGGIFGITETVSRPSTNSVPIPAANPTVHINSAVGAIRVVPIPAGDAAKANVVTVEVVTEVRHFSRFLAQRSLDVTPITPEVRNGEVYIDTQPDAGGDFFFERNTNVVVYVPQSAAIDLRLQFGSAKISGLTGPMTIDLSGGTLDLVDVTLSGESRLAVNGGNIDLVNVTLGGRSDFVVHGGNIDLQGVLSANSALNVEVNGGNADIRLPLRTEARLDATAEGGDLEIRGWPGLPLTTGDPAVGGRASGYLQSNPDQARSSAITLRLNGGGLSLRPQVTNAAPSEPAAPVPPAAPGR